MLLSFKSLLFLLAFSTLLYASTPSEIAHTITIAGTADLQGMMEASMQKNAPEFDGKEELISLGGISRIATLITQLKAENPSTIIVSTGDDLMNRFFHTFKGKAIFSLLSDAGYDIYALGNHEFDKGSGILADALNGTRFQTLCSDLNVTNSALKNKCNIYIIKQLNGIKVGFFSLMTEDFSIISSEEKVKLISDNISTAKKMVKHLKNKGVNVIVALTHIGYKEDRNLAKQVKGIDLIFGGHSHDYVKKMGRINQTAIVNGGEKGSHFTKVTIPLTKTLKIVHKQITMTNIPVTDKITPNQFIEQTISHYAKQFPEAIILGHTKTQWDMQSAQTRKSESTVAAMINDLMKEKFKVDIVLNNGGAFRGQKIYMPGPVSDTMLKEIDEFESDAYTFKLKGKYLKGILEWSAANYGEGGFLQPSGLKYQITLSRKMMKVDKKTVIRQGNRVSHIEVFFKGKWQAVNPEQDYKILSNAFLVNHGGDGYFWFKQYGTDLNNTYTTFYSLMADFLNKKKILSPKEKDGRIQIFKSN